MKEFQLLNRSQELPSLIRDLARTNGVVNQFVEAYIYGQIVTKEELYCQMVVELAKSRDQLMDQMVNEAQMKTVLFQVDPTI